MRELVLAEWPLKLLALLLAFGLWVAITGQDRTLRDLVVPLEVGFGEGRIAAVNPPTTVTVRLEGPQRTLRRLDALALAVRLDLRDAPPGEREVSLLDSHLKGLPRGVEVGWFEPDRLRFVVAQRARRELEVVPEFYGRPAGGSALYGFEVQPAVVAVEGPQETVEGLRRLRTEPIVLDNRSATFVTRVGLLPEHPAVRVIGAERVRVEVRVDAAPVERVLDAVPIEVLASGTAPQVSPATVRVTLAGPPWLMERLEPAHVVALAESPEGVRAGTRLPVRVETRLDNGERRLIEVRSVRPAEVQVRPGVRSRSGG